MSEPGDDDVAEKGAIWILNMNANGTVKAQKKLSALSPNIPNVTSNWLSFGYGLDNLGDLDGDGNIDLVVGDRSDTDGGPDRGAVWILFLDANGDIKSHQKISDTQGNFNGGLQDNDRFGIDVTNIGDIDGDGLTDIAVGAYLDDDGGTDRGAIWILRLNQNGTVKAHTKISHTQGGLSCALDDEDNLGWGVESIGDFDGDGIGDLMVGARGDDDGVSNHGAAYIICLNGIACTPSTATLNDTSCGSYTAPSGKVLVTSGVYTDTIPNMKDCDSLITINLTVNAAISSTLNKNSCGPYTSPSGTVLDSSGTYVDIIPNMGGCDSMITINLVVTDIQASVTSSNVVLTASPSGGNLQYQWLDCNDNLSPINGATQETYKPS